MATMLASVTPLLAADVGLTDITTASYGYAGERANVKDAVLKLCAGQSSCKFTVKPETFGVADPSPGNDKGLIVGWKCGETVHRDQFPGDKRAELKCP